MALPKIEFQVVAKDIEGFMKSLNSVSEATKATNIKILQSREKLSMDIKHLEAQDAAGQMSTAQKVLQMKEQSILKERHLIMDDISSKKRIQEEHFNWTRGLMSRYASLRMGSIIGGSTGSSAGRQIGMAGGALGGPLGALGAGLSGAAFGAVASVVSSMMQGTMQLGGARGLSEMITESGQNEKIFQVARMKVTPDQRISLMQMQETANALSENAELGSFRAGEWGKTFDVLGGRTGAQAELFANPNVFKTIGMLSHMGGTDPTVMAESFAQMRGQLGGNTESALDALRAAFAIGQKGNFGPEALAASQKAVANVSGLGGDRLQNMESIFGIQSIMMEHGWGAQKGGTALERFTSLVAKKPGDFAKLGAKTDSSGHLTNLNDVLSNWASTPINKLFANKDITTGPMKELHDALEDEAKTRGETVKQLLEDADKMHLSLGDLEKQNLSTVTTGEKLQASFNKLTDAIGPSIISGLQDNMPLIQDLMSKLANNLPGLIDDFGKLGEAAMWIVNHIPGFTPTETFSERFNHFNANDYGNNPKLPDGTPNPNYVPDVRGGASQLAHQKWLDTKFALEDPKTRKDIADVLGHDPKNAHEVAELLNKTVMDRIQRLDPSYSGKSQAEKDKEWQKEELAVLKDIHQAITENNVSQSKDDSGTYFPGKGTGIRQSDSGSGSQPQHDPFVRPRKRFN